MPSKTWPSVSRSHCAAAPRTRCSMSFAARACTSGRRQQLAAREDQRVGEVPVAALVRDREDREPIDLVAPEVDAHRMVGRRRVHVDDRSAHRDLAAPLDLVLPPVARADEPLGAGRRGRSARPCAGRSDRCPPRADRAAARARARARPTTAGAPSPPSRSRHMIRRRRPIVSSAGETRSNGSVSHAGNSSTASAPSIGTRSPAMRSASAAVGTASRIGRAPVRRVDARGEQRPRRLGDRDDLAATRRDRDDARVLGQEPGQLGQRSRRHALTMTGFGRPAEQILASTWVNVMLRTARNDAEASRCGQRVRSRRS